MEENKYPECEKCKEQLDIKVFNTGKLAGLIEGVTKYAWWKDGTQYVGTCGTTLQEAIERIQEEFGKN